jgi:hypothetical protein
MSSKELDNLVGAGLLKREPGDQSEFDALVRSGQTRLTDARQPTLAPESQFDLAYNAAHAFALAALRWHGYRPNNRRYEHTLGLQPQVWRVLDKCHRARNLAEYEGAFAVDQQLLTDLMAATEVVYAAIEKMGPVARRGR